MPRFRADGRRTKHVTWSPIVVGVNRPTNESRRSRRRGTKTAGSPEESEFSLQPPPPPSGEEASSRRVRGNVTAHSRRDTHSVLVTIRNKARHREVQLLVDLAEQHVRRIYDGKDTWNVVAENGTPFRMRVSLGDVSWADDGEMRRPDARGFRLDWLEGSQTWNVAFDEKRRRGSLSRTTRTFRGSARRSKRTAGRQKKKSVASLRRLSATNRRTTAQKRRSARARSRISRSRR